MRRLQWLKQKANNLEILNRGPFLPNRFSIFSCFHLDHSESVKLPIFPVQSFSNGSVFRSFPFLLHIHDFLSVFPPSATDDEFVSLSPTVPAIINHMVLHLQHTHTRKHTDARSRSKQSSLWLWSAICIPSQSGPPVFHCVCVWFVSMTLTWNPLYRRRYSHWRRPHTPLRADTCSPDSHYSPARSAGPRSLVNTHTLSDMEIRIKLQCVGNRLFLSPTGVLLHEEVTCLVRFYSSVSNRALLLYHIFPFLMDKCGKCLCKNIFISFPHS